jgi:recombination protein RecA
MYGVGISKEGSLLDIGVDLEIVKKSGAWFTFEGDQLGQGRENARLFLAEHADVAAEIERRVREGVGLTAFGAEADERPIEVDADVVAVPEAAVPDLVAMDEATDDPAPKKGAKERETTGARAG